jgi:hypothetical protein
MCRRAFSFQTYLFIDSKLFIPTRTELFPMDKLPTGKMSLKVHTILSTKIHHTSGENFSLLLGNLLDSSNLNYTSINNSDCNNQYLNSTLVNHSECNYHIMNISFVKHKSVRSGVD